LPIALPIHFLQRVKICWWYCGLRHIFSIWNHYVESYMESSVVFGIKCYLEVYIRALY
jgi:hypothetical protein